MVDRDDELHALRKALDAGPNNVPLRVLIAARFMDGGRLDETDALLRDGLQRRPNDPELSTALARCYHLQGAPSKALVVLEELERSGNMPPAGAILHARILWQHGEHDAARRAYRKAIEEAPDLRDEDLERRLDLAPVEPPAFFVEGRERMANEPETDDDAAFLDAVKPTFRFEDVGGMEAVKREIRAKIIHPLQHPEIYAAYGKQAGGGILLYGPPGCGKTHLARATAGEIDATFLAVGIHDVLEMWIGQSERNLHAIFEQARACAPCVLFFDEVDALGANRRDMRTSAGRQTINQFLLELDGQNANNDGVLVLGATNAPWHLDGAFRRPGRFDRVIFVPPPDEGARLEILRIHLRDRPQDRLDLTKVARKCETLSGADLKALVELAIEDKLEEALQTGEVRPLQTKDLLAARKRVRASTEEWFQSAKNYARFANEGGVYDDLRDWLDRR